MKGECYPLHSLIHSMNYCLIFSHQASTLTMAWFSGRGTVCAWLTWEHTTATWGLEEHTTCKLAQCDVSGGSTGDITLYV